MGATKHTQILLSPRVQKQLGLKGKDESYFVNQWLLLGLQVKPTILVVSFFKKKNVLTMFVFALSLSFVIS